MRLLRPFEVAVKEFPWLVTAPLAALFDPQASEFCKRLIANGVEPDGLVKVLPRYRLIYLFVPKAASTRIRRTLATIDGHHMRSLKPNRRAKFRGPYNPRNMTMSSFFRLATSPDTLRFSFVRNPYGRAVSCWADKFQGQPLVPGHKSVDIYLEHRTKIAADLPAGANQTLSFPQFVAYAAATAERHDDPHIQTQDGILTVPGIKLDFIGKVEAFEQDFARILDHLGASNGFRREALVPVNASRHHHWSTYYTPELADQVYRAYERDFDRFGYPRAIADEQIFQGRAAAV
jgi:Sulfotransferase family